MEQLRFSDYEQLQEEIERLRPVVEAAKAFIQFEDRFTEINTNDNRTEGELDTALDDYWRSGVRLRRVVKHLGWLCLYCGGV